jgi:hypothetical protein
MAFQKCPVCDGSGTIGIGFPSGQTCSVCAGFRIIDEFTGLPPAHRILTTAGTGVNLDYLKEQIKLSPDKKEE